MASAAQLERDALNREADRWLAAGMELADNVEAATQAELRRTAALRDECEGRLRVRLTDILTDESLWRRVQGQTLLDRSTSKARRKLRKVVRHALDVIDVEYARLAVGLLPKQARGGRRGAP